MAKFKYKGRNSSGALVSGTLDAGSSSEVASRLFGDSITPIDISERSSSAPAEAQGERQHSRPSRRSAQQKQSTVSAVNDFLAGNKVDMDELIMFARQMYGLTKAGLALDRALKGLEATISNKRLKYILGDVIQSLENGVTMASALGRHPKVFSPLFLSLVHVGENTGRLDLGFREIFRYLELEKETRKQVKAATRYPIFVFTAMSIALGIITVFVIPAFSSAFERLGSDLPWQTKVLIGASDFVLNFWPLIIGAGVGLYAMYFSYQKTPMGRRGVDKRKLKMPIAGNVYERVALGRFARTFSMVLRSGVPVVQGLTVVASAVGNEYLKYQIEKMREGVERGETIHRTAQNTKMFSPLVLQMIAVGEETGTIDDLLEDVADFYDAEVDYDLKRLSDVLEPILITFMAGLVLILALGVFLPIWDLNSAVG